MVNLSIPWLIIDMCMDAGLNTVAHVFVTPSYLNGLQMTSKDIEKMEEAKLKAKFPMATNRPAHSAFLQKRLLKGVSFPFGSLTLCYTALFSNLLSIFL